MSVKSMLCRVSVVDITRLTGFLYIYWIISNTSRQKSLDKLSATVVIIFTVVRQPNRDNKNVAGENQPRQAKHVTATRNPQPPPARCASSFVPEQRFLRSQRRGAGEIRNATTGPSGQAGGFSNGQGVRFLPPVVLPSRIGLRAKRLARITSPEARSEKRSQAHSGSDEVRGRATKRGAITEFRSAGSTGTAKLPPESAPPQHRTAASAGKKTPISLPRAHAAEPFEKDGLIGAYEELRSQILNGQRGAGLALFMRRGMREWMNACSLRVAPFPAKEFTAAPDKAVLPQGARTEIVLIVAGMLLHGCQERVS